MNNSKAVGNIFVKVIQLIDTEVKILTREEYLALLEEISADLDIRMGLVRYEQEREKKS